MAVSVSLMAVVLSLHLISFDLAMGSEQCHNAVKVMPDEYDERTHYVCSTNALTMYRLAVIKLLLVSQNGSQWMSPSATASGEGLWVSALLPVSSSFSSFSWASFWGVYAALEEVREILRNV